MPKLPLVGHQLSRETEGRVIGDAGGGELAGVVFRCDGSLSIGMGHVVRCSALAHVLGKRGHNIRFVMGELPGSACDFVRRAGFPVEAIACPSSEQDASLTEQDLERTAEAARRSHARCVVVDHYGAASGYLGKMKDLGITVAVIDDLADRDLTSADWLLNQNLGAAGLVYRTRPDCVKLLGPAYALLRPEFGAVRGHLSRKFSAGDRRVLLTFGGGDADQLCAEVLDALNVATGRLEVRCVLGGEGAVPASLTRSAASSRHEVEILRKAGNMAELMAWADLSINGGGSTCWELCCLGVPMVVLVLAPDQALNASALDRQGCAFSLGEWRADTRARLARLVDDLLAEPGKREAMSRASRALVDGAGPERAADSLMALAGR